MALALTSDEQRIRDLRRMKTLATGLLLFAAVVFLVFTRWESAESPVWVGYVVAASEAAMVGAIADWFAVTALFRHPLGLPIPHTAIIPRRKDALAANLADFVRNHFLVEEVVLDKVRRADPVTRAGEWLSDPDHAATVSGELATLAEAAIRSIDDADAQAVVRNVLVDQVASVAWAPPLGTLLDATVHDQTHRALVTMGTARLARWLEDNGADVVITIADQGPVSQRGPIRWAHEQVAERIHHDLLQFVRQVRDQDGEHGRPYHSARRSLDDYLVAVARDLREDQTMIERVERAKWDLLDNPATHRAVADIWPTSKRLLLAALADPDSELRRRLEAQVRQLGRRMLEDDTFRADAQDRLERAVIFLLDRYGSETVSLISDTVSRWDASETSRKIEVAVGRDLQFIRINGTVVGALVGVAIHAVSQAVA